MGSATARKASAAGFIALLAALFAAAAPASGGPAPCFRELLAARTGTEGYLDSLLVGPADPDLPDKLEINPGFAKKLSSLTGPGGTIERIEWQGFDSFAVVKDAQGKIAEIPASVAPEMGKAADYDLKFLDNSKAFRKRYPRWNEIFRTAPSASEGPIYREMRLSIGALRKMAREGLFAEDSPGFTTLYFAGYREAPKDPRATLRYAFDHSGGYLPVIVELRPATQGIPVEGKYAYDGAEYFHTTISTHISPEQIDHIWVFDKNASRSEIPFKDLKPLLARPAP